VTPNPQPHDDCRGEIVRRLARRYPGRIRLGVPLRDLTTIRIGGPALAMVAVRTPEEALRFQELARAYDLPLVCLGGGSNVLADDAGFEGMILKMEIATFQRRGRRVRVGAGMGFDDLIKSTLARGLTGLEFASGIPGTVGGAVVGNAGCFGRQIGELITAATVMRERDGRLDRLGTEELAFSYRSSSLKGSGDLLLEVEMQLAGGNLTEAWRTRREHLESRRRKHPVSEPSAGSYFQNLPPGREGEPRRPAGELLDRCGAKAFRVGDAGVFPRHANIIINLGAATAADVLGLAERMRTAVQERFGVRLREEVRFLSRQGLRPVQPAPAPGDGGPPDRGPLISGESPCA
jgi:UDP-N-acetylmuramate dehydrogenase